jgi:hypothetical protein
MAMRKLLEKISKFKKCNLKLISVVLFNLTFILCYGQDQKQLVFGIDTSFHNEQEKEIVRYQIYIQDGEEVNPLVQVNQVRDDFTYIGSLLIKDGFAYVFCNYSSPSGMSTYYYILQPHGKILTVDTKETETLLVSSLNTISKDIHYIDFNTECGLLMKKSASSIASQSFVISCKSFFEIMKFNIAE